MIEVKNSVDLSLFERFDVNSGVQQIKITATGITLIDPMGGYRTSRSRCTSTSSVRSLR